MGVWDYWVTAVAYLEAQGVICWDLGSIPRQKLVPFGLIFLMIFEPWPKKTHKGRVLCGFWRDLCFHSFVLN